MGEYVLIWIWWAVLILLYLGHRPMGKKLVKITKELSTTTKALEDAEQLIAEKPEGRVGTVVTDEPVYTILTCRASQPKAWVWYHPHSKSVVRISKNIRGYFTYIVYPKSVYEGGNGPVTVPVVWPDVQTNDQPTEKVIAAVIGRETGADVKVFFSKRDMDAYYNNVMMPTMDPAPSALASKIVRTLDL